MTKSYQHSRRCFIARSFFILKSLRIALVRCGFRCQKNDDLRGVHKAILSNVMMNSVSVIYNNHIERKMLRPS